MYKPSLSDKENVIQNFNKFVLNSINGGSITNEAVLTQANTTVEDAVKIHLLTKKIINIVQNIEDYKDYFKPYYEDRNNRVVDLSFDEELSDYMLNVNTKNNEIRLIEREKFYKKRDSFSEYKGINAPEKMVIDINSGIREACFWNIREGESCQVFYNNDSFKNDIPERIIGRIRKNETKSEIHMEIDERGINNHSSLWKIRREIDNKEFEKYIGDPKSFENELVEYYLNNIEWFKEHYQSTPFTENLEFINTVKTIAQELNSPKDEIEQQEILKKFTDIAFNSCRESNISNKGAIDLIKTFTNMAADNHIIAKKLIKIAENIYKYKYEIMYDGYNIGKHAIVDLGLDSSLPGRTLVINVNNGHLKLSLHTEDVLYYGAIMMNCTEQFCFDYDLNANNITVKSHNYDKNHECRICANYSNENFINVFSSLIEVSNLSLIEENKRYKQGYAAMQMTNKDIKLFGVGFPRIDDKPVKITAKLNEEEFVNYTNIDNNLLDERLTKFENKLINIHAEKLKIENAAKQEHGQEFTRIISIHLQERFKEGLRLK